MTEARDISFGLEYEAAVVHEAGAGGTAEVARSMLPVVRCDAAQKIITGSHVSDTAGAWLLLFDNSYSYFRSKTIYYHVEYQPIV